MSSPTAAAKAQSMAMSRKRVRLLQRRYSPKRTMPQKVETSGSAWTESAAAYPAAWPPAGTNLELSAELADALHTSLQISFAGRREGTAAESYFKQGCRSYSHSRGLGAGSGRLYQEGHSGDGVGGGATHRHLHAGGTKMSDQSKRRRPGRAAGERCAPMNWKVLPSPQMTPASSAQWRFGQSLIQAPMLDLGMPNGGKYRNVMFRMNARTKKPCRCPSLVHEASPVSGLRGNIATTSKPCRGKRSARC